MLNTNMLAAEINKKYIDPVCDCPITAAIGIVGGKWKPVIIWILITGPRRFG
jgi:DNA-binding HxlR family transcriptional regulator